MCFEELKKILENKSIEIPKEKLEFFYEFISLTADVIVDSWVNQKSQNN